MLEAKSEILRLSERNAEIERETQRWRCIGEIASRRMNQTRTVPAGSAPKSHRNPHSAPVISRVNVNQRRV
ncbi:MAG: hypothetical protein BGP06_21640 [Rhizobiales bacterium 65-9]|nr:MAG: hypothetical protein BGP06_21640 [Rhizobiales bacterium 65-9]